MGELGGEERVKGSHDNIIGISSSAVVIELCPHGRL